MSEGAGRGAGARPDTGKLVARKSWMNSAYLSDAGVKIVLASARGAAKGRAGTRPERCEICWVTGEDRVLAGSPQMTRLMEDWLDLIGSLEASFHLKGVAGG